MLIYLDTSAVLKRVFHEADSVALRDAMSARQELGDRFVSSALTRVELGRGLRRLVDHEDARALASAFDLAVGDVGFAPITGPVLESARVIGPPVLRSLDAIHLATAIAVGTDEVWTYDARVATASDEMGLAVRMPQ